MRFPPIPQNEWTEEQREVASVIVEGPRGEVRGPFIPLLHAPAVAAEVRALGDVVRFGTGLPNALTEIAICMTARARDCAYIWASHSKAAAKAGVAREVVAALAQREPSTAMNADEALIYAFCSELLCTNKLSDATFDAAAARWGKKGVMELAGLCGYYGLMANVINIADPPLSAGMVPFAVP